MHLKMTFLPHLYNGQCRPKSIVDKQQMIGNRSIIEKESIQKCKGENYSIGLQKGLRVPHKFENKEIVIPTVFDCFIDFRLIQYFNLMSSM